MYIIYFTQVKFEGGLTNKTRSTSLIPLAILRLYYLTREIGTSDSSYDLTTCMLLEVVQMNVAIIVSCIPFSRLIITSVSSGHLATNIRTHAPNFDGKAKSNLSNIEQRIFTGRVKNTDIENNL